MLRPFLSFVLILALGACTTPAEPPRALVTQDGADIAAVLAADGRFTIFLAAVEREELTALLSTDGPLTVFAPIDPQEEEVQVNLHIAPGRITADDLRGVAGRIGMIDGDLITVESGDSLTLNGQGSVIQSGVGATNGLIHVIDRPLSR
ncbi:MAG: fasciclin domain-containing protein [Pseudomonadota bacterium]